MTTNPATKAKLYYEVQKLQRGIVAGNEVDAVQK